MVGNLLCAAGGGVQVEEHPTIRLLVHLVEALVHLFPKLPDFDLKVRDIVLPDVQLGKHLAVLIPGDGPFTEYELKPMDKVVRCCLPQACLTVPGTATVIYPPQAYP